MIITFLSGSKNQKPVPAIPQDNKAISLIMGISQDPIPTINQVQDTNEQRREAVELPSVEYSS